MHNEVKILEAEILVGDAHIYAFDPPMCVAMAKFFPAPAYNSVRHAEEIDGEYVADRSDILRILLPDGSELRSHAISILDFPTLHEIELHIVGIYEPSFDELFNSHPHYRAYFDLDLTDEQRADKKRMLQSKERRRLVKEWTILGVIILTISAAIVILA